MAMELAINFSQHLNNELHTRIDKNPNYSLRSFARQLNIDHSTLVKIINGKRAMGVDLIRRLGQLLNLPSNLVKHYCHESLKEKHELNIEKKYLNIKQDYLEIISKWYYFALLELTRTKNFKQDEKWIAEELQISIDEVRKTVERLIRIGFLEIDTKGMWHDRSSSCTTTTNIPNTNNALKEMQKDILQRSQDALDSIDIKNRDQSSMLMAIDQSNIELAKEKIKHFRREMDELLSSGDDLDSVYQLSVSFFPVTKL